MTAPGTRPPTSHERRAGEPWDASYAGGPPPWDIGGPRERAAQRGFDAAFAAADALHLDRLGQTFDTVLDVGLFHTFDGHERRDYVAGLASVTRAGGNLYVLCFRDAGPAASGPHPVSEDELSAAFGRGSGWRLASVRPDRIETRFDADGAPAWLGQAERV